MALEPNREANETIPGRALDVRVLPSKFVKAHSAALLISHRGTLVQHKAWFILLRNAVTDFTDPTISKHKMAVSKLAMLLDQDDPNLTFLKKTIIGLTNLQVSWDLLEKTGEPEWGVASMLAGCKISKGVIEYDFSTFLREKLRNPKMYAMLNLAILNEFRSKYSFALYELCKDYEGVGQTPWIELDKYRDFQGLKTSEYKQFKRLSTRVIKEPIAEINDISDLKVTVEYQRSNKKVVALKFRVRRNDQSKFNFQPLEDLTASPVALDVATNGSQELRVRLLTYGLKETQVEKLVSRHEPEYIVANLSVVDRDIMRGAVKNQVAYVMAALRDDYSATSRNAVTGGTADQATQARLRKDYEDLLAQEFLDSLTSSARKSLENEFLDEMRKEAASAVMLKQGGLKNPIIKARFNVFLMTRARASVRVDEQGFKQFVRTHRGQVAQAAL